MDQLKRNPRSVFVSYGWDSDSHRAWVARLADCLRSDGFDVVLDRFLGMDVEHVFALGMSCRNILIIGTVKYTETCLLGNVPCSRRYSQTPSFSTPFLPAQEEWSLQNSVHAANILLHVFGRLQHDPDADLAALITEAREKHALESEQIAFRPFWEGWGVDENQSILLGENQVDRIAMVLRDGQHCICRYPIIDARREEDFDGCVLSVRAFLNRPARPGLKTLANPIVYRGASGKVGRGFEPATGAAALHHSDWAEVTFWRLSPHQVTVLRACRAPDNSVNISMHRFMDWERYRWAGNLPLGEGSLSG